MLKLLCFISLAVVSVSASLSTGSYRIYNYNENALKLNMSSLQVVGGPNSSVQVWQLMKPSSLLDSNVYAIMPIPQAAEPIANLTGSLMTFNNTGARNTPQNGDNAIVQPGDMYDSKFQWTINQTGNTSDYYTITCINPGNFSVDLADGSKQEGAKVQAYQSAPGDVNQWWKFVAETS